MATGGLEAEIIDLLAVFMIAGGVGIVAAKATKIPYTIALLLAGFIVSVIGVPIGIRLTHDVIILLLLPPLLFEGAKTTDVEDFRKNLPIIVGVAIPGLVISILTVGVSVHYLLGFEWLIALLFAIIILPTDPVSVLAIFEEIGAPERLSVLVEGESLINDGLGVVLFTTVLALIQSGATVEELATVQSLIELLFEVGLSIAGGAAVGLITGYGVYRIMYNLDEHMTEIILTILLAYGSFLIAEHYLHVSGVIATVVSGLLIGNRGREYAMSPQTKLSVFNTWETGAFIVNTFIFVVIGIQTPIGQIIQYAHFIVPAILIVLLGRAIGLYPIVYAVNTLFMRDKVSREYSHVMWWGGLHASIPIALVLGLPETVPRQSAIRVLVFGISAFSLVVQGLTIRQMLNRFDITTVTEDKRIYELLVGRARAVDTVLERAEELHQHNHIPTDVYERFTAEYEREKEQLDTAISNLLDDAPELKDEEKLLSERQLLKSEQSAIKSAELNGLINTDTADKLLDEVNLKLDRVQRGESTVVANRDEEGYEEFWRVRAHERGLIGSGDEGEKQTSDE